MSATHAWTGFEPMITAIVTQWIQYQMNKFSTNRLFIFFAACMKPLLRSEGFHPGRHIKGSSEHEDFKDRCRASEFWEMEIHGAPLRRWEIHGAPLRVIALGNGYK